MLRDLAHGAPPTALLFERPSGGPVRHNVFYQYVWQPVTRLASGRPARTTTGGRTKVSSLLDGVEPVLERQALAVSPRIHDLRHTAAAMERMLARAPGAPLP